MTKIQLLDLLAKISKEYRPDARVAIVRNHHMNDLSLKDQEMLLVQPLRAQKIIDATLVDFINKIGVYHGRRLRPLHQRSQIV